MATSNFFICIPLQQHHKTLLNKSLIFKQVTLASSSNSVILEEEEEGEKLKEPQSTIPSTSSCKACGREEIERGCNGEGRIQGGIATVPGFGWWPIKAFRPCPGLVSSGGRYRRRGQSMDEVASGESKRMKKIIPKEINDEIRPEKDETQSRKKKKMGVEKQVLRAGTGPKTVPGQSVTVHCTGFGKNGDISQKFWSTKDWGQQPFTFEIGQGSVIKSWDEGVLGMQLGEVARLRCSPDFAYGAAGFPAWGILPNSVLEFEIELLSSK